MNHAQASSGKETPIVAKSPKQIYEPQIGKERMELEEGKFL